jgi:dGTPase
LEDWIARRSQARTSTRTRFNAGTIESHFQRDRARVIHSAWFRALQSKTQVLGLGESDFYRTRLTHSLEVAQIGSGIVEHVRGENARNPLTKDMAEWIAPLSLIDAACLAHDIGHSPFGHGGEVALNYMMRNDGGFEANGQTLRILSRLGEYSEDSGLDLTRRSTLSVIKYPGFCTELAQYHSTSEAQANTPGANGHSFNHALNIDHWHPPKGIYEDEREVLDWVLEPFTANDRKRFQHVEPQSNGHAKTVYKSLDTSIMELADDIAYGVHDLEDAVAMSLLSPSQWQQHFLQPLAEIENNPILSKQDFYSENLFSGTNKKRKHAISKHRNTRRYRLRTSAVAHAGGDGSECRRVAQTIKEVCYGTGNITPRTSGAAISGATSHPDGLRYLSTQHAATVTTRRVRRNKEQ